MKKIKSIKHLNSLKKQLSRRKAELEKAMHYDWKDLKESIKPKNAAGEFLGQFFNGHDKGEKNKNDFIADGFSHLAATLARKLAEKAEEKLAGWFKK